MMTLPIDYGTKVRFDIAPGMEAEGFIDSVFHRFDPGAPLEAIRFYLIGYLAGGRELTFVVRRDGQFHLVSTVTKDT